MRIEQTTSYPVSIFIGGDFNDACCVALAYCNTVGLCVSVTATTYIYTRGEEDGVIVGLINYPRFPKEPKEIVQHARALADRLREDLRQESYSIQTPDKTVWFSWRAEDGDSDGTATAAANGDLPVLQDCQARAESIAKELP